MSCTIFGVLWLEEPLDHYDIHGIRRLTEETEIAIAGGEIMNGIQDITTLIDNECYDIYMPNITLCCGISHVRKIAAMAERAGAISSSTSMAGSPARA